MKSLKRTLVCLAAAVAAITGGWLVAAPPAAAASLTEVTGFGANPSNLRMFLYVPDRVATRPAVLVAAHYCTGSGQAYYSGTEFASLADRYGFIVIYPSATRSGSCFDVSSSATLTHNGGSDSLGVVSMVRYVLQHYNADASRVFAVGSSSGAMLTNVLLGAYPDVFAGGAAFAGVPFGCFATTDGSSWNSACANGQLIKTAQEWGNLVRNAYPGYSGARPRMQLWHGTADDTLRYPNFGEEIKQWTNVHGLSQTATYTDSPVSGWTRTRYGSTGNQAPVEAISINGGSHNILSSGMAARAITFFGLDTTQPTQPTTQPTTRPTTQPTTQPTTRPTTAPTTQPVGCRVTYSPNIWNTGLTANITITNTSGTPINGWSLVFTLPSGQNITSGWNATYSPTSGQVTARNVSYNGTIPPGGSTTIGFQATHTGNTSNPTSFSLNGTACAIA